MMLAWFLVLGQAVAPVYRFPSEPVPYVLELHLKGFIPILKGVEGSSKVTLGFQVAGLPGDSQGRMRVVHEPTRFEALLDGTKMPFTIENVRAQMPRTTVTFSALGRVFETTAAKQPAPIPIPGLDVQRFPEVSYLPLEWPEQPPEIGGVWTFTRTFREVPMRYRAVLEREEGSKLIVRVVVDQEESQKLNEFKIPLLPSQLAAGVAPTYDATVTTRGEGWVHFDRSLGRAVKVDMTLNSRTTYRGIVNDEAGAHQLETKLKVEPGTGTR